jgi:hypothetical protein
MLNKLGTKWGLMVCGATMLALGGGFGQCIADFLEDALIFRIVD